MTADDGLGPSVLDGLDDVDWHRFGPTGPSVPATMRQIMESGPVPARDAALDLADLLVAPGFVAQAAPSAVSYMMRIAAAGVCTLELLDFVGTIARTDKEMGSVACCEAVVRDSHLIRPLLGHEDPDVRESVILTLSVSGVAEGFVDELIGQWSDETSGRVRASIVLACARLDPSLAEPLISDGTGPHQPDRVRAASLVAFAETGLSWGNDQTTVLLDLLPLEDVLTRSPWADAPLADLLMAMAGQGPEGQTDAVALITRVLSYVATDPEDTLYEAVLAARDLGDMVPTARPQIVAALAPLAGSRGDASGVARGVINAWRTEAGSGS